MFLGFRTTAVALAVVIGSAMVVTARAALAPNPPIRRVATDAERKALAEGIASQEPKWTKDTTQHFPADLWSQRDDFHSLELRKMVELSREKGVRIEETLRAVDDDLHRRAAKNDSASDDRNVRAIPCKPRPFYD
jgi:hypothetical protein